MRRIFCLTAFSICILSASSFTQTPVTASSPLLRGKSFERRILKKVVPTTPERFRTYDGSGTILSIVFVNSVGNVEKISIITGKGFEPLLPFIEKALYAWKFKPLIRQQQAVPFRGLIRLNLRDGGLFSVI
jgi:hypothetical protein